MELDEHVCSCNLSSEDCKKLLTDILTNIKMFGFLFDGQINKKIVISFVGRNLVFH